MHNYVLSPITLDKNVKLLSTIKTEFLIDLYQKKCSIDVSRVFSSIDEIYLYECLDTGYQFYYPYNISGDNRFYAELEKFDWYYNPWKWEHQISLNYFFKNHSVLEVGSGFGDFIYTARKKFPSIQFTGLEFNLSAINHAKSKNVILKAEDIIDFAKNNPGKYDVVCSFQVLEHVSDVNQFIKSQIEALKLGGKLIISVPNNKGFLKMHKKSNFLNFPPHHMGLWDRSSLGALVNYFPLKLVKIHYEPLQQYHFDLYINGIKRRNLEKFGLFHRILIKLGVYQLWFFLVKKYNKLVKGHSILAVFEKTK